MRLGRIHIVVVLLCFCISCKGDSSVTQPTAIPQTKLQANATALVNLMAIEAFEHAASPSAQLVAVSGFVDRTGRLASASPWYYTYRDPPDATSTVYQWRVDAAGVVTHEYFGNCGFFYPAESADRLSVDSDQAVAAALQAGGDTLLQRHSVSQPTFGITYVQGTVVVRVNVPDCSTAFAVLDAASGAVVRTDFSCADVFPRQCTGPGIY